MIAGSITSNFFYITRRFVFKFESSLYKQLSFVYHIRERWIHVIPLYSFFYLIVYITSISLASFIKESLVAIELFLCFEKMCAFICVLINILLKYRLICRACYKTHDFKPAQNNWHESISCDDHKKKSGENRHRIEINVIALPKSFSFL